MPFVFQQSEYCYVHFVYGFCDNNARNVEGEYQRCLPEGGIPPRNVFSRVNHKMRESVYLPIAAVQSDMNRRQDILEMVQGNPRLATRRIFLHIGV